jgi:F-type H+-transporting ATPase subunit b
MQEIFQQLGNLFLGAAPTAILFIILVICYQLLVQRPLQATLKERHARTEGAVEAAHEAIARAEARAQEYADKLRLARQEVYKSREERLKRLAAERDIALDAARKVAGEKAGEAKAEIEAQTSQARQAIEASVGELAAQVVRAVLPQAAGGIR